ncbi:MAG: phosphoribosylformylglycinamidine synthase subunit PurS [Alphaproteobacteria bacterium]|nr:phosphoribosylformylglycinamidine synthase subunit PurS [Alphaproteobacteria bacterium]
MKAIIHVTLKTGVLDPQGKAIANTLHAMGFDTVNDVRQGKYIELDLLDISHEEAEKAVDAMCSKLLANTVIENYTYELTE